MRLWHNMHRAGGVASSLVLYPDLTQNQNQVLGCDYESQKTIQPAAFPEASIWTLTAICDSVKELMCTNAFHPHKYRHTMVIPNVVNAV